MNLLKKASVLTVALVAIMCMVTVLSTCKNNIGLGGTVDINPPVIHMDTLYPPMNAVVRGAFVIAAEVSDDTEAESVFVTLKHKYNAQVSLIEGYAQSNGGGLWQLRLGDKVLPADGEYEVSVTARDKAGKSVNTKTALTIDNTPPLLVLQRPSTAALVSTTATEYDVFGDVFLLVGEVYDDNGVEKLLIKAKNGVGTEKEATLTNIPQNIRLKVDTFSLQGRTEQEAQGGFYRSIYGGQQNEGKKPFSYTLTISDNAKEYKKPGDGGSGSGNSTDVYYLYDELYSPLLKKYKLSEVYAALRQRTTVARMSAGTDSSEVLKLLENPEIKIGGTGKRQGTFALNPAIDPHYSLEGYNPKAKGEPFTSLYSPTVVTVKLMQNLDSDPLAPTKEYKVYLLEYEAYQKEVGFDINNDEDIYSDVANKQLKSWIKDITPSNMDRDGGNYTAAITVDADKMGLMYGKSYVVQVRGTDQQKHPLRADSKNTAGSLYGFKLAKLGKLPEVSIEKINEKEAVNGRFYVKKGEAVAFKVQVSESNSGTIKYSVNGQGEKSLEYSTAATAVTIEKAAFSQTESKAYSLSVKAEDKEGSESREQKYTVFYDVDGPVITADVPGTVTTMPEIKGDIFDAGIGVDFGSFSASYSYNGGTSQNAEFAKKATEADGSWTLKPFQNGEGAYEVTLTAQDKLGQSIKEAKKLRFMYDVAAPAITDLKIDGQSVANGDTVYNKSGTVRVSGEVKETNGIKTFTINGENVGIVSQGAFTKELSFVEGTHAVKINLVDKAAKALSEITLTVIVDITSPRFENDIQFGGKPVSGAVGASAVVTPHNPVKITGTIDDVGGVKEVLFEIDGNGIWEQLNGRRVGATSYELNGFVAIDTTSLSVKTIRLKAVDQAGNESIFTHGVEVISNVTSITLDLEEPSPTDGKKLQKHQIYYLKGLTKVKIHGRLIGASGSDPLEVTVTRDGNPVSLGDFFANATTIANLKVVSDNMVQGFAIKNTPPADGEYEITVKGVGAQKKITVIIDNTAPDFESKVPSEGQSLRDLLTFYGTLSDGKGAGVAAMNGITAKLNATTDIPVTRTGSSWETSPSLIEGNNSIEFTFSDELGNKGTKRIQFKYDSKDPVLSDIKVNGQSDGQVSVGKDSSGIKPFTVEGKVWDSNAMEHVKITVIKQGISSFEHSYSAIPIMGNTQQSWSQNIVSSDLSGDGIYIITITAEDLSGRTTVQTRTVEIDGEAPTVHFEFPSSNVKVNKTITVKGSANDNKSLAKVTITDGAGKKLKGINGNAAESELKFEGSSAYNWSFNLDTEQYTDNQNLVLKAIVEDKAGNTKTETLTLSVNQDSDRPVITVTSFANIDGASLIRTSTLIGTISDDDGAIKSLKISLGNNGYSDAELMAGGTLWQYTIPVGQVDAELDLKFDVTDYKDSRFEVGDSTKIKRPKVLGALDSELNYKDENIKFKYDNNAPVFRPAEGVKFSLGAVYDSASSSEIKNASLLGNGNGKTISVRAFVKDQFAIKETELTIGSVVKNGEYKPTENTIDGYEAWDFENITLTDEGSILIKITATDKSGFDTVWQQAVLTDFKAPEIKHVSPSFDSIFFKEVELTGSITDVSGVSGQAVSGVDQATIEYKIGNSNFLKKHIVDSVVLSEITGTVATWKIEFKNISLYKDTALGAVAGVGGVWTIPVQIKARDKAGNEITSSEYTLKFDPNGTMPYVEIIMPTNGETLGGDVMISGLSRVANPAAGGVTAIELQLSQTDSFNNTPWILNSQNYGAGITIKNGSNIVYWSYSLPSAVKNEIIGSNSSKDVWFRVRGKSGSTTGEWTTGRKFTISKEVAQFSEIKLKKNIGDSSGTVYAPNALWIKGNTFIVEGTVTHPNGIKNDIRAETLTVAPGVQSLVIPASHTWFTSHTETGASGYKFAITVDTSSYPEKSGYIEFDIIATDNKSSGFITVYKKIQLKYDNTSPSVAIGTPVGACDNAQFTAGVFTARVKIKDDKKSLYKVFVNNKAYEIDSVSEYSITLKDAATLNGAFDYGIVELPKVMNGTYQVQGIAADSGSGVQKVTARLQLYKAGGTELGTGADMEKTIEMASTDIPRTITGERGEMVSFKQGLDTTVLKNGKAKLTVTVYDGADSEIMSYIDDVLVKNAVIEISNLTFKTDLSNDGSYDSDEIKGPVAVERTQDLETDGDFRSTVDVSGSFAYKNKSKSELCIEFTGGYGTVEAKLYKQDGVTEVTSGSCTVGSSPKIITLDLNGKLNLLENGQKLKLRLRDDSIDKLWYAETSVTIGVVITDALKPKGVILPFFYNGKDDNSLKANDSNNGHIELAKISSLNVYPSVSGTVILRGIAYDNIRIKKLELSGSNITSAAIQYTAGVWQSGSPIKILKSKFTKEGHYVEWEYEWATETPALAQAISLTVTDDAAAFTGTGNDNTNTETGKAGIETGTGERDPDDKHSITLTHNPKLYQFIRLKKEEMSYLVQINSIDGTGKKVKWLNTNVPDDIKEYELYTDDARDKTLTVNVVPYVTRIETALSALGGDNDPNLYARTALGRYPVRDGEAVKIHGFNLTGAVCKVSEEVGQNPPEHDVGTLTGNSSPWGLNLATGAKSGKLTFTVASGGTSVTTINNDNNNSKPYNKAVKTANNDKLTDDLLVDVWQFKSDAVKSKDSSVAYPVMKIHPDAVSNGKIGFAFANGTSWFSMASNTTSYTVFQKNWDLYQNVGFTYGPDGKSYGIASGTDVNTVNNPDTCGLVTFFEGAPSGNYNHEGANYNGVGGIAFESIGLGDGNINKNRIQSPSIAAGKNVYIAYYDLLKNQLRVRTKTQIKNIDGPLGQPKDSKPENYHVVVNGKTPFVALGVVSDFDSSGSATNDTAVVLAYYDAFTRKLKLKYNTTPVTLSSWTDNASVSFSGGQDVQLAVDRNKGIHLAYTTNSGNLAYAYSNSYNGTFTEYIIDSYSLTGSRLTIDIANDANGKPIPYIGYFMQGAAVPKFAYLKNGTVLGSGAESDYYTGTWEVSVVPTPKGYDSNAAGNKVNIGVWKNKTDGKLTTSKPGSTSSGTDSGTVYGNGTSNPVLGYVVESGTIETAQKK